MIKKSESACFDKIKPYHYLLDTAKVEALHLLYHIIQAKTDARNLMQELKNIHAKRLCLVLSFGSWFVIVCIFYGTLKGSLYIAQESHGLDPKWLLLFCWRV